MSSLPAKPSSARTILAVDDNKWNLKLVEDGLVAKGFKVLSALNGTEALEKVEAGEPDLVLLDLMMPGMDGYEVCRRLKSQLLKKGRFLPIIMVTVKDEVDDLKAGFEAGADDYLVKPFNMVELQSRINAALRTKELQERLEEANRKLHMLTIKDDLTGLFNQTHFYERMRVEFKRAERSRRPIACLFIDGDNFKGINDRHGHAMGSHVIKELAKIFSAQLRETDLPARYGGDEYVIGLPDTDIIGARVLASRLMKKVRETTFVFAGATDKLTISTGASARTEDVTNLDLLLKHADEALYRAKAAGRDCVVCYGEEENGFGATLP